MRVEEAKREWMQEIPSDPKAYTQKEPSGDLSACMIFQIDPTTMR